MTKKTKKFKMPFKTSWLSIFASGVVIGVISQRIPQIRAYTDEILHPIEQQLPIEHDYSAVNVAPGMPISYFHINRNGYSLAYDAAHRNPAWVYEHLTANGLNGNTDRSHFEFLEDDTVPEHLRAMLIDYKGQGFDRGHMAPAADHRATPEAMKDTFYLTNMCPQCPQLNRGYWSKLERHVRDLTKMYEHVHVITGPLYLPYTDVDGNRYVKYQVIGKNDVAVPTHFFKVIVLESGARKDAMAFILPNQSIDPQASLDQFKTTIQKVEKVSGILFSSYK